MAKHCSDLPGGVDEWPDGLGTLRTPPPEGEKSDVKHQTAELDERVARVEQLSDAEFDAHCYGRVWA
jgi:hypothetical protein